MLGIKKYYGLRGNALNLTISFIAGLDFLYALLLKHSPAVANRAAGCSVMTRV